MNDKQSDIANSLLDKVLSHSDKTAYRELFFMFFAPLCIFANRYTKQTEQSEDIVQEVFFKIWEKRDNIAIESSVRNYLITSVRNSCIDHIRKEQLKYNYKESIPEDAEKTDDLYSLIELELELAKALSKLPSNHVDVFRQSRFQNKTYPEIADSMSISIKTVEAHMTKVLKHLRTELKDYLLTIVVFGLSFIEKIYL